MEVSVFVDATANYRNEEGERVDLLNHENILNLMQWIQSYDAVLEKLVEGTDLKANENIPFGES